MKLLHLSSIFLLFITSCIKRDDIKFEKLELLSCHDLAVVEPSGLTINNAGDILYTVSDNTGMIYQLNTNGAVTQTFDFVGEDLEAISMFTYGKLLIGEERSKNILEYNYLDGSYILHLMDYQNNDANAGIEGVTYDPIEQNIYIINEKNPGMLFKLNANFQILAAYNLSFASDYSDLFYEQSTQLLWILSDESQSINKCTKDGTLLDSYAINVEQPEGIAVTNDKIYIVSDPQKKMYIFAKPD